MEAIRDLAASRKRLEDLTLSTSENLAFCLACELPLPAFSNGESVEPLASKTDHFYWLNNLSKAAPLYARAEKLFADKGDARNEIYPKVGRLRSDAEAMSFDDLSRLLNQRPQNPIVRRDRKLRIWCLITSSCGSSSELLLLLDALLIPSGLPRSERVRIVSGNVQFMSG